jgi:GalNAc-alpha-(1->4)-GalNAc-alpha-(1->3)-diNAcBac-PP-undecaprenol alpha-1,4-N-acetyl-D-galactosaminyltransferase
MLKKMSKKHTFILIVPSLQPGGLERVMAELANFFSNDNDIQVHLVLFGQKQQLFYPLSKEVKVHQRISKSTKKAFDFIDAYRWIRKTTKKIQPDAILSFGTQWNNLVLMSLMATSYPVCVSDRGAPNRKYKFPQEHLRQLLYPRAKAIIAQTNLAKDILQERFPKSRIDVIGNPIRHIESSSNKENIVLSIGRLIESKHHDRLIQMFNQVDNKNWKLVIVGGDALKQNNMQKLQKLISELDLKDKVELLGASKEVEKYLSKSKIFAFSSSVEGFPNVVGEAMSAGLPVVAYDCVAGPKDLIDDGETGFLIPLHDEAQFQTKLSQLMQDEELQNSMGKKAKAKINEFSVEVIGTKFKKAIIGADTPN